MATFETYDREQVYEEKSRKFSRMEVPPCTHCGKGDTASVQVGVIWITIRLAANCRTFKLIPNGPKPGQWFCHSRQRFFDVSPEANSSGRVDRCV